MKKTLSGWYICYCLLMINLSGFSQDLHISRIAENILVNNDSSFTRYITVDFYANEESVGFPVIYDEQMESLTQITLSERKGRRLKTIKNPLIKEDDVELDYLTSKKVKYVILPQETRARISYQLHCDELMYLSNLPFFSYYDVDTIVYSISVPDYFWFRYDIVKNDSLKYLTIDSLKKDNSTTWHIKTAPVIVKSDPLMLFGIYKNLKVPLMRTIVYPRSYNSSAKNYLKDWYLEKIGPSKGLDSIALAKIDELTDGLNNPEEITSILYNYVKSNFKYVAIEIGMGAFIPSHVNEVFRSKQGDCKALSNFLCEALKYKGINSTIALASTFNHICNCDYPSLCSANHLICIAYLNNKTVLLDPTDPIHRLYQPVESIQNRSLFIIAPENAEFYTCDAYTPEQNLISYNISLEDVPDKKRMSGTFNVTYNGISGNYLKRKILDLTTSEINSFSIKHYENTFNHQKVDEFNFNCTDTTVSGSGFMSVSGKKFSSGDNDYLFLDFIPDLFENNERETLLEGTYVGNPFEKRLRLRLKLSEPVEPFEPIEHKYSHEGMFLHIKIYSPTNEIIEYQYDFSFDDVFTTKENTDNINDILNSFKKFKDEPLILKVKNKI
ncbi:transglutaminase-like domain-containing protein [Saccharicrinis sp. FJH54]|uniref:transglutaminase-like domain-containing protein n=1 Tax=Saccharicrinis sp. FJH54 TaxID=3344665 RepID=UPI0035D41C53